MCRLEVLAQQQQTTVEALTESAMARYTDDQTALSQAVAEAEEEAERDGWLTSDQVFERLYARAAGLVI